MSELRSPENMELRAAVDETCELARDYADETLMFGTVDVSIDSCHYPFYESLPDELQQAFRDIDHPAKNVAAIDMQLTYDRAKRHFRPKELGLQLDNEFRMVFSRTSVMIGGKLRDDFFYPQLLTPERKLAVKQEQTPLVLESLVYDTLKELGVGIPLDPQEAKWKAIEDLLQFSRRWSAHIDQVTALGPQRAVRVESRRDGVGMVDPRLGEAIDADENDTPQIREIIVAIEDSPAFGERPTTALQLAQQSDGEAGPYVFRGITRTPIDYEFDSPNLHYRAPAVAGETVIPDVGLLGFIQDSIIQARDLQLKS